MSRDTDVTPRFGFPIHTENVYDDDDDFSDVDDEEKEALKQRVIDLITDHGETITAALEEMAERYQIIATAEPCEAFSIDEFTYGWHIDTLDYDEHGLNDIHVHIILDYPLQDGEFGDIFVVETVTYVGELPAVNAVLDGMLLSLAILEHTGLPTAYFPADEDGYIFLFMPLSDEDDIVCGTD